MAFCDAAAAAAPASLPDPDATAAPAAAVAHLTSGARSFGSLADVEVQSVLRLLDSRSRLRAARCSRHLYRLVQAPFVWQDGAPFLVRSSQTDFATRLREHPLLRHAPIHLRRAQRQAGNSGGGTEPPVAALAYRARLGCRTV